MVRQRAQEFIQQVLEEEVTELLGRQKSERRAVVDGRQAIGTAKGSPGG
jgi:hypothetical protein